MNDAMTHHSDAELLAAFVDGQLDREQLEAVTAHLGECEECRGVIGEAVAFQEEEEESQRKPRWQWAAVAAVVVVAVMAYPLVSWYMHQREVGEKSQALFRAEAATERPIETRLTGQLPGRAHRASRGDAPEVETSVEMAAEDLKGTATSLKSPLDARAAAAAQTAIDQKPSKAIPLVEAIAPEKRDAATWNDLAALLYGEAGWTNAPDDLLKKALAAADEAHAKQPEMPEALFNRALILEKLQDAKAADAWKAYLAIDQRGPWADDAREHLHRLQ